MPTSNDRWQKQVNEVFDAAVELAESARTRFLDQACGEDRELRAEVESLLASDEQARSSSRTRRCDPA